jgi:acyl dehydratase
MAENLPGLEDLKSRVGVDWEPRVFPVERDMIRRFVRAVGDDNPLWSDEKFAKETGYGAIIAPPTFVLAIGLEEFVEDVFGIVTFGTVLMGGTEIENFQPIKLGDVITATFKVGSLRERTGKMGSMVFMTFESTYKNQQDELVAKCRQMVAGY